MEELIGRKLGQYLIETKIGSGGMATIFKAYQPSLERYVAIKVLPPSLASKNPVFVQRFEREAKSIARLNHPNILPVYDFGVDADYSYIVMRYVEGAQTLGQIISYSLGNEHIIDLVNQVAGALTYAHRRGVIHRDVKPSNILLDGSWALLSDFGLARVEEAVSQLTDSGMSIGTPAYMSPEQARGEIVDPATDIYALGVIVYEMMTHTIPHNAPTPVGILMQRITQPPPSPRLVNRTIPASVEQVMLRALAVNPADRYESALDFAAALKEAMTNAGYQTFPLGTPEKITMALDPASIVKANSKEDAPTRPRAQRLRRPLWLVGLALGIIGILAWWGSNSFRSSAPPLNPSPVAAAVAPASTPPPSLASSPASTPTFPPPTDTPLPSPSPTPAATNTPVTPTVTPVVLVVTATATATPPPTPTPSPTLTFTPGAPEALPTVTTSSASGLPTGTFVLRNPLSLTEPTYGPTTFEWEWQGEVPPGYGFEVRVWRAGEPPAGVHDAVLDNHRGRIEKMGENQYRLQVDISQAAGVRKRTGEYLWTVVLVQISPTYADTGVQAEPAPLRFEAGGSGGDGNDGGGGGSGGGIS